MSVVTSAISEVGKGYMAADSFLGSPNEKCGLANTTPKVVKLHINKSRKLDNTIMCGIVGEVFVLNTVSHLLESLLPEHPDDMVPESYLFNYFCGNLSKLLHDNGRLIELESGNGRSQGMNAQISLIYRHCLFRVSEDLSCVELNRNYDAIGAGAEYALGAMFHMAYNGNPSPKKLTISGAVAAEANSPLVDYPILEFRL